MNREQVINYLRDLSESEMAQIIHESAQTRREEMFYSNGDFQIDDAFALATCTFGAFGGNLDDGAIVELFAPAFDVDKPMIAGSLTEQGQCSKCKVRLISHYKRVLCPICKTENNLT